MGITLRSNFELSLKLLMTLGGRAAPSSVVLNEVLHLLDKVLDAQLLLSSRVCTVGTKAIRVHVLFPERRDEDGLVLGPWP